MRPYATTYLPPSSEEADGIELDQLPRKRCLRVERDRLHRSVQEVGADLELFVVDRIVQRVCAQVSPVEVETTLS